MTLLYIPCSPSVPYAQCGADETQALPFTHHKELDAVISNIFEQSSPRKPAETTYALLGGASTVLGAAVGTGIGITVSKLLEREPSRFIDPFTASAASSIGVDLLKALPAAVGTIATLVAGYKFYGIMKAGFVGPLERKFDKLVQENNVFKDALKKHQAEYEAVTEELIKKRLETAETAIKALLGDWFQKIDTSHAQVIGTLTIQKNLLEALKNNVPAHLHAEIDKVIEFNNKNAEIIKSMHAISPEILEKHSKKHHQNAISAFLKRLFKGTPLKGLDKNAYSDPIKQNPLRLHKPTETIEL